MVWSEHELNQIAESDDLHIAPLREDGVTYGTPTWIWSVFVEGGLYVRAYNGQASRWYQAALRQQAGQITAAGMTKDVSFEPVEGPINDRIDEAYRAKYHGSPYLSSMIGGGPRSATVRVTPKPWIVPIPGTKKRYRLEENLGATGVQLTAEELQEIDEAAAQITLQGARYSEAAQRMINR